MIVPPVAPPVNPGPLLGAVAIYGSIIMATMLATLAIGMAAAFVFNGQNNQQQRWSSDYGYTGSEDYNLNGYNYNYGDVAAAVASKVVPYLQSAAQEYERVHDIQKINK